MLKTAYASGAQTVILTPHYPAHESVSAFCARRNSKLSLLKQAAEKDGGKIPSLLVGAEVPLYSGISENDDLKELCIDRTDVLLLELPFLDWNKWYIHEICNVTVRQNVTPVLAHIERYLHKTKDIEKLSQLIAAGVKFQINATSFLTFSGKHIIKALAREGLVCAIGSDCHNVTTRSPNIADALRSMTQNLGDSFINDVNETSAELLLKS